MKRENHPTTHPGIEYYRLYDGTPLSVHIVEADNELCCTIPARALNSGLGRECLSTMASRHQSLAAINGGYFIVGTAFDGRSNGLLKIGDRWFASPRHECSSIAWNSGTPEVQVARLGLLWTIHIDGQRYPIDNFNSILKPQTAVLYSGALHRSTLSPKGSLEVAIRDGFTIDASFDGDMKIPENGWVYSIASDNLLHSQPFKVGAKVDISKRFVFLDEEFKDWERPSEVHDFWNNCDFILSGGPVLIQDGVVTANYDHDTFKQFILYAPHPRSAVGVKENGNWIFAAVEGRQPNNSIGMSVQELAHLMRDLGCVQALNLDGGASVLLIVEGKPVNEPMFNGIEFSPEEVGQRRIADAFLIVSR